MGCRTRNGGFWEFCSSNPKVFFFSFSKFLSLVSSLGLGLVLDLGLELGLWLGLGLNFKLSSLTVRELVLSLTRLSFPLVRFRHNH